MLSGCNVFQNLASSDLLTALDNETVDDIKQVITKEFPTISINNLGRCTTCNRGTLFIQGGMVLCNSCLREYGYYYTFLIVREEIDKEIILRMIKICKEQNISFDKKFDI